MPHFPMLIWLISILRYIMNQLIKSSDNQVQCQIPANLPVDSPEMMAFIHDSPPIECDTVDDWVSCHVIFNNIYILR